MHPSTQAGIRRNQPIGSLQKCLLHVFKPPRDKTNILTCARSEDPDQPGHPPSLIRVFVVRSMGS